MKERIFKFSMFVCAILCCTVFITSCGSDDDDKIKFDDVTLTAGQSYTIPSGSSISWTSSNDLIATVSSGVVKALRVGEARITSSEGSFNVTVNASLNLYREPCLDFGASMSTVKSYMSGYTLSSEDDESLIYEGKGIEVLQLYMFENGAMKGVGIPIYMSSVSAEDLATYLSERYVYIGKGDELLMLQSIDEKVIIGVKAQYLNKKAAYMVIYADAASASSSSAPLIEKMGEQLNIDEKNATFDEVLVNFEEALISK